MARLRQDADLDAWQSHERRQVRDSLRATPAQCLAGLEEMMLLSQRFRRLTPRKLEERSETRGA